MTTPPEAGRRLAAVWFADIVGYTTLSATDEDGALELVAVFQRIAEEVVAAQGGRVVKYIGDAALAEFASTDGAIRSALALMERFLEHEGARQHNSTLRIGVNVGEVMSSPDGDIYGDGVNLASRLQNQAEPGQVVASDAVHAQIRQRPVFRTESLGNRAVKGIADPVTLYSVTLQEAGDGPPTIRPHPAPAGPAPARSGALRWVMGAVVGLVAVAAVVLRFLPGTPVAVTDAAYGVVEGGMEIGGSVTISFSGAVDQATATSGTVQLLDPGGEPVAAMVSVAADQRSLTLDPNATLAYANTYTLVITDGLRDAGGKAILGRDGAEGDSRITIRTQPVPDSAARATARLGDGVDPDRVARQGPVSLRFSEAVDPRSAAEGIRITEAGGAAVAAGLTLADGNQEVLLEPTAPLVARGRYEVHVDSTLRTATGLGVEGAVLPFRVAASAPARRVPPTQTGGAAAPTAPAPSRAAATGPATLNLTVVPTAARSFVKVVVDGDTLGAPPLRGVGLAEGRAHTIAVIGVPDLSAYTLVVFRQEVTPRPGQVVELAAAITAFGSIDVVSEPAGIVFVDGRQVGRTPLAGYPVTAGVVHRLEIRPTAADEAAFDAFTGEFRVESLEWKSLGRLALPPKG